MTRAVGSGAPPRRQRRVTTTGATVSEVIRILGHTRAQVTLDRYADVLQSMQDRTDERLDAAFRRLDSHSGKVVSL